MTHEGYTDYSFSPEFIQATTKQVWPVWFVKIKQINSMVFFFVWKMIIRDYIVSFLIICLIIELGCIAATMSLRLSDWYMYHTQKT
jgi:hypothetical protein